MKSFREEQKAPKIYGRLTMMRVKKLENRHCGDATHVFTIDGKLRIKLQHLKFIKRCYVFCKVFI